MNGTSKRLNKKDLNSFFENTDKSKKKASTKNSDSEVTHEAEAFNDTTMTQLDEINENTENFGDFIEENSNENSNNNDSKEENKQLDSAENEETGLYFNTSKAYPHTVLAAFEKPVDLIAESSTVSFLGSVDLEEITNTEITGNHLKQRKKELDEYQNKNINKYQKLKQQYEQSQQKFIPTQSQQTFLPTQLQSSSYQNSEDSISHQLIKQKLHLKQKNNFDQNLNLLQLKHLLENYNLENLVSHSSTSNQRTKTNEPTTNRKNHKNNDDLFRGYDYNKKINFDDDSQSYLNVENFKEITKENERLHIEVEKWKNKYLELRDCENNINLYKLQADSYKEDFERERADREAAMGRFYDVEKKLEKTEEMLSLLHRISNLPSVSSYENKF